MHKSRLGTIVIDCQTDDLEKDARFWGEALGATPARADSRYVWLKGRPEEVQVIAQKVDHASRVHMDIETDDIEAEVDRLASLGATIVERLEKWVVMEAPSKQRFCVIGPTRPDFEENANHWA